MMWWAIWCTLMVTNGIRVAADPSVSSEALASIPSYDLAQIDPSAPDDDDSGYGSPLMDMRRFEPGPWVYQISEMPRDQQKASAVVRRRLKRKMPSLSISNPMEVLRQRLMMEVARKQMREANQRQAVANRLFLQNVGKRGYWETSINSRYN